MRISVVIIGSFARFLKSFHFQKELLPIWNKIILEQKLSHPLHSFPRLHSVDAAAALSSLALLTFEATPPALLRLLWSWGVNASTFLICVNFGIISIRNLLIYLWVQISLPKLIIKKPLRLHI